MGRAAKTFAAILMKPKVSVVIPVFNGGNDTHNAIQCALAQTDCDVEVIVVNDGSTDQTLEVLAAWGDRIVTVNKQNEGISKARNAGIQMAKGEWVAFLDNDDEWLSEKLTRQLHLAEESGADAVYTNTLNFGDAARVDTLRHPDPSRMPTGDLFEQLLIDNFLVTSSMMVRKSALDRVQGFTESPVTAEDWDLWLKLAADGCRFAAVADPLTRYRWRSGSYSKNHERMRQLRKITVDRALMTERGKKIPWKIRRQALANIESCSAWFLAASSPRKAVRWYVNSILQWHFDVTPWKGVVKGCLGRN